MKNDTFGLGYTPSIKEHREAIRKRLAARNKKKGEKIDTFIHPYPATLNGQFMKQGDDSPYYEFPEPFIGKDGKKYPGIEIFTNCNFIEEGITDPTKNVHTLDITDVGGLGLLFGQEKNPKDKDDILMIINIQDFDPTELITPADHIVQGWRKTLKITTPQGKVIGITVGEGQMFEDSESESESESESRVDSIGKLVPRESVLVESVKEPIALDPVISDSVSVIPAVVAPATAEASFDMMVSDSITCLFPLTPLFLL